MSGDGGIGKAPRNTSALASVVVVCPHGQGEPAAVAELQRVLAEGFEFSEIVVITSGDAPEGTSDARTSVRRIRCDGRPGFDELAALGYAESLGDVVVVASADELHLFGVDTLLGPLLAGDDLVRVRRRRGGTPGLVGSAVVKALTGRVADSRFYRTLGISRSLLSTLSSHPDQLAFMRFAGTRSVGRQTVVEVDAPALRGGLRQQAGRVDLTMRLVAESAPRLLRFASTACALFAVATLAVAAYAVLVWLTKADVASGWTSTTLLMACWMFVQSSAMAALCLGAGRLLDRSGPRSRAWRVVSDSTAGRVFPDTRILNVDGGTPTDGTAAR